MRPETRYLDIDGQVVAYQVFGEGPNLTFVTGLTTHIDVRWDAPVVATNLRRLGSFARVISFDRRGTGASERFGVDHLPTWETWADDLERVLDAVDAERTWLLATLDGGPYALLFAAAHPDRLHGLVLGNTAARFLADDTFPQGIPVEDAEELLDVVEEQWGTEGFARLLGAENPAEIDAMARLQRASATPAAAAAQFRMAMWSDHREVASAVTVPTVVLHRVDYPFIPVRLGRDLAERIPDARFVELPGERVVFNAPDSSDALELLEELVTGKAPQRIHDRRLAAVVFTDIVGSSTQASTLGDGRWRTLLDRHDELTTRVVVDHGGRVVKSTGDGVLAVFDRPSRAVFAALELRDTLEQIGLVIRAGVHMGEVELRDDDLSGVAVNLAKRIEGAAAPGEVLVSRTIVELSTGSGIQTIDRGLHVLKGIPGEWPLFAASHPGGAP